MKECKIMGNVTTMGNTTTQTSPVNTPVRVAPISEMIERFKSLKGCKMMTITIRTQPRLRASKSNPLNGRVVKFQSINGAVGYNYEAAVNRQRTKDHTPPDFEALSRRNMVHIGGSILKHNKTNEHYVFLRPLSKQPAIYYVDGRVVTLDKIAQYLYSPPKKDKGGSQGVSKEIPYINIKVSNIIYVKGFGHLTTTINSGDIKRK